MTKMVMASHPISTVGLTVMTPMQPSIPMHRTIADNTDNNYGGQIDEGVGGVDGDGDGFTTLDGDCDDTDATVNPSATEIWYDGVDQDCDCADDYDQDGDGEAAGGYGGTDCDDTNAVLNSQTSWFADLDGDGYGDTNDVQTVCVQPTGYILDDGDCDDTTETSNPAAEEICDGMDNDCDGSIPLNESDQDQDGYVICDIDSSGWLGASSVIAGGDCQDMDPQIHPGVTEVYYNGLDQDCDQNSDYDADGDGFDSDQHGGTDCDDTDATISPSANDDTLDGIDNNCDGQTDEGVIITDNDQDGFTNADGDCDDSNPNVNPGATEIWYDGSTKTALVDQTMTKITMALMQPAVAARL